MNMRQEKCLNCGKMMEPALECVILSGKRKGEWDEHTFKCDCSPGIYLSIG